MVRSSLFFVAAVAHFDLSLLITVISLGIVVGMLIFFLRAQDDESAVPQSATCRNELDSANRRMAWESSRSIPARSVAWNVTVSHERVPDAHVVSLRVVYMHLLPSTSLSSYPGCHRPNLNIPSLWRVRICGSFGRDRPVIMACIFSEIREAVHLSKLVVPALL